MTKNTRSNGLCTQTEIPLYIVGTQGVWGAVCLCVLANYQPRTTSGGGTLIIKLGPSVTRFRRTLHYALGYTAIHMWDTLSTQEWGYETASPC